MELARVDTRTIPRRIPISPSWFDTRVICDVIEEGQNTRSLRFLPNSPVDDEELLVCAPGVFQEVTIAEAFATTFQRALHVTSLEAFLMQWARTSDTEQLTRALSPERFMVALRDQSIESLSILYAFAQPEKIRQFLVRHPHLISPLFEIYTQARRVFRDSVTPMALEYVKDSEEDFEGLTVVVKTKLPPDQSLALLEKFDQEWWLDLDFEVRRLLAVITQTV